MDMLEAKKDKHIVAPGLNWLIATLEDAAAFGYTHEKAEQVGYKKELDTAIRGLREMHRRGIVVLPGGDYGELSNLNTTKALLQHLVANEKHRLRLDSSRHLRSRSRTLQESPRLHCARSHHCRHRWGCEIVHAL